MNRSMSGLPVHHQFPESTQTHVHWVGWTQWMPSNHLILCRPLLLLLPIFPNIRVLSNESVLSSRWPKYWSFSFNIGPSNAHPGLISFRIDWLDLISSYLFSVASWPMRKEQWLRARLSHGPCELPGSGGTTHSCDFLGPWEPLD